MRLAVFILFSWLVGQPFVGSEVYAQENSKLLKAQAKKAKKYINWAKEYIRVEEYHFALSLLKEGIALVPESPELHYYMGVAYLHSRIENKRKGLSYLRFAKGKAVKPLDKIDFYLGKAYHYNHELDSATSYYLTYKESLNPDKDEEEMSKVNKLLTECEIGKELMGSPLEVSIKNLGAKINTDMPEFSPVISADEEVLIFTSRRDDSMGTEMDPLYDLPHEDIYIAEKDENGDWQSAVNIGIAINTDEHDAAIGLAPDARELFLYKSTESQKEFAGDIFVSRLIDGEWSTPKGLPKQINSEHWETHASVTASGKVLIFTSDRDSEGAQGGKDIYIIRKLPDGNWAEPENLGSNINTPYNEESPFIHPNGKVLYFSSEGHQSMGGFDIFYSRWNEETQEWGEVHNIGYPINTAYDDVFFTVSADGSRGYFSSIRDDSKGGQDIYMVDIPQNKEEIIVMKGRVMEKGTKKPLKANIKVYDKHSLDIVADIKSNPKNGHYMLLLEPGKNYGVHVSVEGYLFKSYSLGAGKQKEYLEITENFRMKPLKEFSVENLNNIGFTEYNDLLVSSEPEVEMLTSFLESLQGKGYNVEIAIHDATKQVQDSLVLKFITQAKADAIMREVEKIYHGKERLAGKGYGLGIDYPLVNNDTRLGRRKNKRIEYIIRKKQDDYIALDYNQFYIPLNKKEEDKVKEKLPVPVVGENIDIPHQVQFATSSNQINEEAQKSIDYIVEVLDHYPEIGIEVGGHTDNVGRREFNLLLGKRRAEILAQKIIYKGVEKERVFVKSYGEDFPEWDNNTPEGRAKNRRITFKVVDLNQ